MSFLVQFLRFGRGVPEVVRTLHFQVGSSEDALQAAKARMGAGAWPTPTDALRVMDDGGRTLIGWLAPTAPLPPYVDTESQAAQQRMAALSGGPVPIVRHLEARGLPDREHFEVGQAVTYASDAQPDVWRGGFEILGRSEREDTRRYRIRSADEASDRDVGQHNLREDLGARTRGQ